jgi:hypothetical protein
MRIEDVAGAAFGHIFRSLFRRALAAIIIAALAVVALCYFTLAGTMALEMRYGALDARVIVGAMYAAVAIIVTIVWAARGRSANSSAPVLSGGRDMQVAMLVEAVMLGYALARKSNRAS